MTTETQQVVQIQSSVDDNNVIVVTTQDMVTRLLARTGSCFMGIKANYDFDTKMKKKNNPVYNTGLRKIAKTLILVNFDYAKAVEKRTDGEEHAAGTGTWHYMLPSFSGSYSPLSVHKEDIQSYEPFLLKADTKRFYLRGEFRKSESYIVDSNGNKVDPEIVKPYLLKVSERTGPVDFHVVALANVTEITIDKVIYRLI